LIFVCEEDETKIYESDFRYLFIKQETTIRFRNRETLFNSSYGCAELAAGAILVSPPSSSTCILQFWQQEHLSVPESQENKLHSIRDMNPAHPVIVVQIPPTDER